MDAYSVAQVRSGAKDARNLEDGGLHPEALRCADRLASKYPTSPMAHNLVGVLNRRKAKRAGGGTLSETHYDFACRAYSEAARLAPSCIVTAVAHAEALADCHQYHKAMSELNRAIKISTPVDPAVNYAGFEIKKFGYHSKTKMEMRLEHAANMLSVALDELRAKIDTEVIQKEMRKILLLSSNETVRALNRAKLLADEWPFSRRAQLLLVHIHIQHDFVTNPGISKADMLRRTMSAMKQLEKQFPNSLVIALLMAMLMDELDYPTVVDKCREALASKNAEDPMIDAIPPDRFTGTNSEERIASAKAKIKALHDKIISQAKDFWGSFAMKDSVTDMRVDALADYAETALCVDPYTIHAACNFYKKHHQWDFVYGGLGTNVPYPDSNSLLSFYAKSKWYRQLPRVLGDNVYEIGLMSETAHLDFISYIPSQNDSLRLLQVESFLESMISHTDAAVIIEFESDVIEKKVDNMKAILDDLREQLRALPQDANSIKYMEACTKIQESWRKALVTLYFDYREIILHSRRNSAGATLQAQLKKQMSVVNMHRVLKQPEALFIMEPFCFKCWEKGHTINACRLCLLCSSDSHSTSDCTLTRKPVPVPHLVGCAERGQQFHVASELSSQHAIAVITVEAGSISVEELVQEFNVMFGSGWKWAAMEQGQQKFHMKFPNVATVEALAKSLLTLKQSGAVIRISKKESTVRPSGKLSLAWVVIDGVPDNQRRSMECLREIGSMIGLVKHIDIQMLEEYDKVRMEVYIKDHNKLPHREMYVVDGDIYYLDFTLESVIVHGFTSGNCSNKNEGDVDSKHDWSYALDGRSQFQLNLARSTELHDVSPNNDGKPVPGEATDIKIKSQEEEASGKENVATQGKYYEKGQSAQTQQKVVMEGTTLSSDEYVVIGKVVPQAEVNLFAYFCKAADSCQETYTICHICSIDGVADLKIKTEMVEEHIRKVHKLTAGKTYECVECHTRALTCADIRRHHYFAHVLPKGWWKRHIC